ncbi:ATP-dependent RNA helicase dbp7 [Coemansia sp. RSA 1933]|nr:ATP-dependent RNA helicase dbp7 [Coemansia sp. RSA 1933]
MALLQGAANEGSGGYQTPAAKDTSGESMITTAKATATTYSSVSNKQVVPNDLADTVTTTQNTAASLSHRASKHVISSLFTKNPEIPSLPQYADEHEQRVASNAVVDTSSFAGIGLDADIAQYLETKMEISNPTAIQQNAIPAIIGQAVAARSRKAAKHMDGDVFDVDAEVRGEHDVFIQAATGSGKTLAYLLPIFQRLVEAGSVAPAHSGGPSRDMGTFAIILTPTRELAQQVYETARKLAATPFSSRRSAGWVVPGMVMGGEKKQSEKARLRKGVSILACTPGRLLDHLENTASFDVTNLRWLVLDEADRLMELGFEETLTKILAILDSKASMRQQQDWRIRSMAAVLPKRRINVLCSATLRDNVKQLANESLVNPVFISAASVHDNIEQAAEEAAHGKTKIEDTTGNEDVAMGEDGDGEENFSVPSQLVQKSVVVPAKLRLVTLVAQLKNTFRRQTTSKLIVFLSCKDAVDFMYFLFAHGAQEPAVDDTKSYADDLFKGLDSDLDDDGDKDAGKSKRGEKPDKSGPTLKDEDIALESTVLPGAKLFRLHGSMQQKNRTETFAEFSKMTTAAILFTTDVAARGLDLPNVTSIIQFDPPSDVASYLHRVGRTARLGRVGEAVIFLLPSETEYLALLQERGLRPDDESMERVLKQMAKNEGVGKSSEWQLRAAEWQATLERFVITNVTASRMAKQAFLSSIRAYATHISAERHIFHVRHLHFGHLAKAFALRETPTQVASGKGNNQRAVTAKSDKKRKKDELAAKTKPKFKRGNDISEFAVGNIGSYYGSRSAADGGRFNNASGELERIVLSGPKGASAEIYMYGATVTSWKSLGKERLFVSTQAKLDGSKPVRGGIPLVFPQFGPGDLPQHGFARTSTWTLAQAEVHGEGVYACLELRDSAETRASRWPYKFLIQYTVDLTASKLSTIMKFENVDVRPFDFTALMHTYFRVPSIADTAVVGLKGVEYADKIKGTEGEMEARESVSINANEDRVYRDVPGVVSVGYGGERILVRRFNFKDIVLWNPWAQKAAEMSDFADSEYNEMICVEAGTVASKVSLCPGQVISCGQLLAIESGSSADDKL